LCNCLQQADLRDILSRIVVVVAVVVVAFACLLVENQLLLVLKHVILIVSHASLHCCKLVLVADGKKAKAFTSAVSHTKEMCR
jgi:hypothetical protein